MTEKEREMMLDLLCDKFVYGLSEEEANKLEEFGYDPREAESIEQTIAALSIVDLESEAEMPVRLQEKLRASASDFASGMQSAETEEQPVPQREIVLSGGSSGSWFGWLGWAAAAVASIALAVTLFIPRSGSNIAGITPTPTPVREERLDPQQQRQKLMGSPEIVRAEWGPGNMNNMSVSGDVVWSDEKQAGYMRFRGLPKNDPSKETYQLWIFDETQSDKTPIDGGTFDVGADGEVVIPIDAKLKARGPKAFAVTMEKPGGVVVSDRKRIVVLGAVKPAEA